MHSSPNMSGALTRASLVLIIICVCCVGLGFHLSSSNSHLASTRLKAAEANEAIRLNKVFKATHSRRKADELIASGRVTVNYELEQTAGRKVVPFRDIVCLDGEVIKGWEALNHVTKDTEYEYVKYWKDRGVTCTTDRRIRSNIIDQIRRDGYRPRNRVYPVGRLDRDTSGLILLTSDGRLPNSALRGQYKQPKTYEVLINRPITNAQVQALRDGVVITTQAQRDRKRPPPLTARTKPCIVERIDGKRRLRMTLMEGRNRQIRKMIEALGLHVIELHRTEFMRIQLTPLHGPGDWAPLSKKELDIVYNVIAKAERETGQ